MNVCRNIFITLLSKSITVYEISINDTRRREHFMVTFFDLIQDTGFRTYVENRLITGTKNPEYSFSNVFPALYKYRSMSKYTVDDILSGSITATSIGEFNDLFDGSMHNYGTTEERTLAAENKWNEYENLCISAGISDSLLNHDHYVDMYVDYFKKESRLKFRTLDYLGTYVCCLSSKCDSTLMWAHYANSNTGVCIEYDFNDPKLNSLQKNIVFPIAYSQSPIELRDLLTDKKNEVYQYPIDAAVLCAALNKSNVWSYENEWRIVLVLTTETENKRRLPLIAPSVPKSIAFGYHFLKPFFYYDYKNKNEHDAARDNLCNMLRLLAYIKDQKIPVSIMIPSIGGYSLSPKNIEIDELTMLIKHYFHDNIPENMRYYYTIHDELMDLLEKAE